MPASVEVRASVFCPEPIEAGIWEVAPGDVLYATIPLVAGKSFRSDQSTQPHAVYGPEAMLLLSKSSLHQFVTLRSVEIVWLPPGGVWESTRNLHRANRTAPPWHFREAKKSAQVDGTVEVGGTGRDSTVDGTGK